MGFDILVLDIEGTVCPITFVKDVLFPFFLEQVPLIVASYQYPLVADAQTSDPILETLAKFPQKALGSAEDLKTHIFLLVEADVKEPVLKALQGLIWRKGYESGALKAPVYEDAVAAISTFSQTPGKKVYIYSSGSIAAQKLLFGHVQNAGDINGYLSGYFDITTAGFKNEKSSYATILKEIGHENSPTSVLFLSDNINEVRAAKEAGMESYIVVRPGNAPLTEEDKKQFKVIETLTGIAN